MLVPEEILHPEYASFVRQPNEHGMPNLQGPSVGCSDGLLKLFDSEFETSSAPALVHWMCDGPENRWNR